MSVKATCDKTKIYFEYDVVGESEKASLGFPEWPKLGIGRACRC